METSGKRDVVQKSLVAYESAAPATSRSSSTTIVHILTRLKTLVSTQGETGELTRRVLSSERVVRLFANLLNVGRLGRKQEILLDMMNVVMRKNAFANQGGDWSRQIIVHELVHCAYRSPASSMTNARSVLHTVFRQHENSIPALWVVLQQCTKLWCGEELNGDNVAESIHTRAGALAELVKVVVLTLPRTIVRDIVQFMNQRLFSSSVSTSADPSGSNLYGPGTDPQNLVHSFDVDSSSSTWRQRASVQTLTGDDAWS
ncbi:hypothetical protein PsorP6_014831 [Peronosclerospora sorghi]|uniref:Uncharacterized protein n=1 Tax=Peronosclerospora sorghi TaxID=230839 RepID=A0ACC0VTF4_9STRA|nr:hypothetical protein PsorP6_014831 [Peronosclerospora sorghi]